MNLLKSSLCLGSILISILTITRTPSVLASNIPTQTYDMVNEDNSVTGALRVPDFSAIILQDLGHFSASGFIPNDYDDYVGYGLGRQWQAGDRVVDVLKLGDLDEALGISQMSLGEMVTLAGDLSHQVTLDRFGFIESQTVADFVRANPQLQSKLIKDVPPLAALVLLVYGKHARAILDSPVETLISNPHNQNNPSERSLVGRKYNQKSQLVTQIKKPSVSISEVQMGELDLSKYTLEDVSGMKDSLIGDYEAWKDKYISEAGFFSRILLSNFFKPISTTLNFVSRVDFVWGDTHGEVNSNQSISGSNKVGYAFPCKDRCAHLELDNLENSGRQFRSTSEGGRWMLGNDPNNGNICPEAPWGVDGGRGILGLLNCGREPTGRNPFGSAFKVALWDVDETTESAETAIFFRICIKTLFVDFGCTPYFIGPIPWLPVEREDWIIVGPGV